MDASGPIEGSTMKKYFWIYGRGREYPDVLVTADRREGCLNIESGGRKVYSVNGVPDPLDILKKLKNRVDCAGELLGPDALKRYVENIATGAI